MPAPTSLSDVARKTLRSTLLIHDLDAIDTVADLNTITPGAANATRNLEPRHLGVQGQAPSIYIEGAGGNHAVTFEIVVWGVDTRLITIGVPVKFNNVQIGTVNPKRINLGVAFTEVQGWSFQTLTGVQAGDFAHLGYDLGGEVVLLCDTSAQATRPTLFVQNLPAVPSPLIPMPTANITSRKRHTLWGPTGKPTATTASVIFIVPPAITVV